MAFDLDRAMTRPPKPAPYQDTRVHRWTSGIASERWVEFLVRFQDDLPHLEREMLDTMIDYIADPGNFRDNNTRSNDPDLIRADPTSGRWDIYYKFTDEFNTTVQRTLLMVLLRVDAVEVDPAYLPDEDLGATRLSEYA